MFSGDLGGHIAWLIPAALILGLAGLWIIGRRPRTDVRRAALLLWERRSLVTGLTFSLMDGIFHQYYTVALAPSIAALVGIGGWLLWTRRAERWALPVLAAVSLVTTGWAFVILARSPEWNPWLRWVVLVVGLVAAAALFLGRRLGATVSHRRGARGGCGSRRADGVDRADGPDPAPRRRRDDRPGRPGRLLTWPGRTSWSGGLAALAVWGGPGVRGDLPGRPDGPRADGAAGQVAGRPCRPDCRRFSRWQRRCQARNSCGAIGLGAAVLGQAIGAVGGAQGRPERLP